MPECTSISKRKALTAFALLALMTLSLHTRPAFAADNGADKTAQPEDDDFSGSPFTEYGEFNEEADEASDTRFYQYGRFFGVSLGLNYEGATGNRGRLWNGGFPGFDVRIHYWFDFNLALSMGLYNSPHDFSAPSRGGHNTVSLTWVGVDLKYYFDTRNLSSGITFASPYLMVGGGSYQKTETPPEAIKSPPDKNSVFGFGAGAGLEFAISPRKTYFFLEGKIHYVRFKDIDTASFSSPADGNLPDLNGMLYTFTGGFLFTW